MTQLNPRAVIGDNQDVDQAQIVSDRLTALYFQSVQSVDELLGKMPSMPEKVSSDADALMLGALIKQLRDQDNKLEAFRESEKQPFLRGGNAVDNFFHSLRDKIARRKRGDRSVKPGAIDILQGRIDVWLAAKRAAEVARLETERLEAARLAREEQMRLRKALEEAEAARLAAERARKAESIIAKAAIADAAEAQAAHAQAVAELAAEKAKDAQMATEIKTSDLVRTRSENGGGVLLTSKEEGFAVLLDRSLIDMEALRPYFTDFELSKALRAWAKTTDHKVQMSGAEIGRRNIGVVR
jgi:hypothetical protein